MSCLLEGYTRPRMVRTSATAALRRCSSPDITGPRQVISQALSQPNMWPALIGMESLEERRLREAGDQQMEMLKSELRKAEDSLARMVKKQMDTETVDKMRKMKNQNESLGAENFEYAVENVGFNIEDKLWIPLWLLCHSAFCLSNLPFCVNDEGTNRFYFTAEFNAVLNVER